MKVYRALAAVILTVTMSGGFTQPAEAVRLVVSAGEFDREACPVSCALPPALREAKFLSLTTTGGKAIPTQRTGTADDAMLTWIIRKKLPAGESRIYELRATDSPAEASNQVVCHDDGKKLTVTVRERPVLVYNHAIVKSPPGIKKVYRRGGYIHPLYTPGGAVVTDDFAPNHPHQHGIFFAFVNTTLGDRKVDFWNQAKGLGNVLPKILEVNTAKGPVFADFTAEHQHVALGKSDYPAIVLKETWEVRVYNLGNRFLFDVVAKQTNETKTPLVVNEYHYGGFGIRGSREWESLQDVFLTSEGKRRKDGNHSRARWVEMNGEVEDAPRGLVVLGHPENFHAPQHVRLHPKMPYFCFAPMVAGEFTIEPGGTYTSRYRVISFDGDSNATRANQQWNDYARPPTVKVAE